MNVEGGGDSRILFHYSSLVYQKPTYQALQFYKLISFKCQFTQPGKTNKLENWKKFKRFTKQKKAENNLTREVTDLKTREQERKN